MRIGSVLLLGIIVLLLCMNATANNNGSIQVIGMASVVIPADTVTIAVRAQSSDNNTTQALIANYNLLNKTKEALTASGISADDILPGYSSRTMTYYNTVCSNVNNTTICRYETSHIVASQITIQMKRDNDNINKTLQVAKSSGASAIIAGYSISNPKAVLEEVRKKALENAQENAQNYASVYGFTLGKTIEISEVPGPDIEIGSPIGYNLPFRFYNPFEFGLPLGMGYPFGGAMIHPGMAYVRSFVRVTYAIS